MKRISRAPSQTVSILFMVTLTILILIACGGVAIISPEKLFIIIPLTVFVLFVCWSIYWTKAFEVFYGGDFLFVRKGQIEDKISLSNISRIQRIRGRQPYVRIFLRHPCIFGSRIDFFDTSKISANPFSRLRESDELIAIRACVENTTAEALRIQERKWSHPWVLYFIAALFSCSYINAPSGPIEILNCTVLDAAAAQKQMTRLTLKMADDSTIEVMSKQNHQIGSSISCVRQRHRVTGDFSYKCQ